MQSNGQNRNSKSHRKTAYGLERRARKLTENLDKGKWSLSPLSSLEREIALTVDHIERVREIHRNQLKSLFDVETYIDTELMQMEERTPRYSHRRFPEREKSQRRLQSLEAERRKLKSQKQDKLESLHDRLLSLMDKHSLLENGD